MNVHASKTGGDQSRAAANDFNKKQQGNMASFRAEATRADTLHQRNRNAAFSGQSDSINKTQPLQRQILGESGFTKSLKLAEKHARFDSSLGFTPPTVNSRQIARGQDVTNAFKGKNQLVEVLQNSEEDFSARVGEVPQNHVGYIMYLPEFGPWIKDDAKKKDILALLGVLDNGSNLGDTIKLEITGRGGHEKLAEEVQKHESVHAKDNERIRDAILMPWDLNLTTLKKRNAIFNGKTAEDATHKLWVAVGGTLEEKAEEVSEAWGKASDAFHKHDHGKTRMDDGKSGINEAQTYARIVYYLTI
ncbi:hypothetical protein BH11BAC7_BH11BAC7_01380 [soil metagenome]